MYVVILAGTTLEAMRYANAAKLKRGRYRYALRAATIRGLRVAEVHILPGFARRLDRHAILAELRYAKFTQKVITPEELKQLQTAYPLEKAATLAERYRAIYDKGAELPKPQRVRNKTSKPERVLPVADGFFG